MSSQRALLPRSTPAASGVSSRAIAAMLDRLEDRSVECHSVMVVRCGHVVAEGVAVGDDVGDGVAPGASEVDDPVAAVEGAHGPAEEAAAEAQGQHREEDAAGVEAAGGGGDEGGADDLVAEEVWVLLGQAPKRTPVILGSVATASLVGFWLERNALVWPSLIPDDGMAWAGPIQFGIAAGFLGAFALVYLVFSRIFPTLPLPQDH